MPLSREELLEADETPIIIAPSGMLSGGFSPTYLLEFTQRYDEVRIIPLGTRPKEHLAAD